MTVNYTTAAWSDIPGFGTLIPMSTQNVDPRSQSAVAARITALRQARGLIKAAFARSCGMTPQQLNNYETGGQMISTAQANKIASSHGVSYDYIYRGLLKDLPDDLREIIPLLLAHPKEPPRPPKKPRKT
jgi:transcriptional regulator with XRE-family HTH domain